MINNEYLIDVAKALNGEAITEVAYLGFGDTVLTITPSMTDITGEILPRSSSTNSRISNIFSITGLKSGASITSPTGIYLNSVAAFLESTGGTPRIVTSLPNLLQTTNFDIDCTWDITINRR